MNANDICRRVLNSRAFQGTKRFLTNHGADIFSVLAGIGVITTGISAFNAGRNTISQKNAMRNEQEQQPSKKYLFKPVLFGAGTIGCIYGARHFGKLKEESLLAACSVLASYSARKRGSEKANVASGESDNVWNSDSAKLTSAIEDTGYGDIIFTEDLTGRKFKSSLESVYSAIDLLQDEFERHNFVPLNSFYAYLGLQPTSAGDILGWSVNQSILDPYLDEIEYNDMKDALTDLNIYTKEYPCIGWVIHYPVMPIGGIAGVGPCNY